jgi:hypothetical protein
MPVVIKTIAVKAIARRPMCGTVCSIDISISLVPLLVPEFPPLLRLVLPQFGAVAFHKSLSLLVVVQTIPFGPFVLPLGIFTPISSATAVVSSAPAIISSVPPVRIIAPGAVHIGATRAIVCRRLRIIAPSGTADHYRKVRFSKKRTSRD